DQGYTQNQLGGGIGGPVVPNRLFAFGALQGRWRGQALPSLATADAASLERLGVSPDSAARFLALAGTTGAPMTVPDLPGDRATDNSVALLRIDWNITDAQTLMLRLDGRWSSQDPTRVSPLALPATGGTRAQRAGGAMASLSSHFGGGFINEVRGYVSTDRSDASGFLELPEGRVQVGSNLSGSAPGGGRGIATLAFGGNPGFPQQTEATSGEVTEEVSWLSAAAGHRLKPGLYLKGTRQPAMQAANQYATFVFQSHGARAAGQQTELSRTIAPPVCVGGAVPTPDWTQYAQDPATIPAQCVDTATTVTITPHPNATVFDPGYAAPHAWRASLGVQRRVRGTYTVSVDASYARGRSE